MGTTSISRASFLAVVFASACFSPKLPPAIVCGAAGQCPPDQRCEEVVNACVPADWAPVTALRFDTQPGSTEAMVDTSSDDGTVLLRGC